MIPEIVNHQRIFSSHVRSLDRRVGIMSNIQATIAKDQAEAAETLSWKDERSKVVSIYAELPWDDDDEVNSFFEKAKENKRIEEALWRAVNRETCYSSSPGDFVRRLFDFIFTKKYQLHRTYTLNR